MNGQNTFMKYNLNLVYVDCVHSEFGVIHKTCGHGGGGFTKCP